MNMELRFDSNTTISSNSNGEMVVEGYVNETNKPSNMLGKNKKFIEIITRGAWTRALQRAKEVHFYAEHDKEKILASTRNGSLELREDDRGLYMKATISPTSWGKDYYQLISDGILQNMSFGFRSVKDSWKNHGSYYQRTVEELDLFEVSVVRDPAYSASSIAARGIDVVEDEVPEEVAENVISLDLRANSEELELLAEKLFGMIAEKIDANKQEEPETEVETEEEVEEKVEDEVQETETEDEVKTEDEVETEEEATDEENEAEAEAEADEQGEDPKDDEKNDSQAIREFIENIKNKTQEEK